MQVQVAQLCNFLIGFVLLYKRCGHRLAQNYGRALNRVKLLRVHYGDNTQALKTEEEILDSCVVVV